MRINMEFDDELMSEAMSLSGAATKQDVVDLALRELVGRYRRLRVLELRGTVHWAGDLDQTRRNRT